MPYLSNALYHLWVGTYDSFSLSLILQVFLERDGHDADCGIFVGPERDYALISLSIVDMQLFVSILCYLIPLVEAIRLEVALHLFGL